MTSASGETGGCIKWNASEVLIASLGFFENTNSCASKIWKLQQMYSSNIQIFKAIF